MSAWPPTTHQDVQDAVSVLRGAHLTLAQFGTVDTTGATDTTSVVNAALSALYTAGGGTLELPVGTIRCDGQIAVPNSGATTYPRNVSMRWVGQGAMTDPVGGSPPYPSQVGAGGTFLDLRYSGGGTNAPKIDTRGKGLLEIAGLTFTDLGTSTNPFLQTTNTTLHVHDCAFVGNTSKAGTTCDQDAIVLGGTSTTTGGNAIDAPFQGYGTVIAGNYFGRIRRAVYGRMYCNGTIVRDNNIWITCGSNLTGGAAIEFNPGATPGVFGNSISGNLIEIAGYPYGILLNFARGNTLVGNNFYDPATGTSLACIRFDGVYASDNIAVLGFGSTGGGWPGGVHVSEQTAGENSFLDPLYSGASQFAAPASFSAGVKTAGRYNYGINQPEITVGGFTTSPSLYSGTGTPLGNVTAKPGSLYLRTDGGAGTTLYVKETGTDATGWVAK